MTRPSKQNFKPGRDYIGVGGGVLIFNKKKEVLLLKRGKRVRNQVGWWAKPGGRVEYDERAISAMKREIKEETGIEIDIWGYLPHSDDIMRREGQHWVAFNYLASVKRGRVQNLEPHKCDEIAWFNLNKLPNKIVQNTRESIKNYLNKKYIKF